MRIAVVQSLDGYLTCCGPNDFGEGKDHDNAMDAAICWSLEAGHVPAAFYWAEVDLPPVPSIPELRAKAIAGEFPKSFIDEMDTDASPPDRIEI